MTHPGHIFNRLGRRASAGLLAAIVLATASVAHGGALAGDQATKAAMIYNFGRFTAWPDSRFIRVDDPVVICVDPLDPLATYLSALDGKSLGARNLAVLKTPRVSNACDMAFVSDASANDAYLESLTGIGVLTVGESPGFSRAGAIRLITIGRQIRFEINQRVAARSGAHLSSSLMRLAVAVR